MLTPELVTDLIKRSRRGRPLPRTTLRSPPARKTEFPKVLAIDMTHWVHLGRAHYGKSDSVEDIAALEALRRALKTGRLIAPIHFINAVEGAKPTQPDRRERIARFMVDTADNHFFMPGELLKPLEIRAAVRERYRGLSPVSTRPATVGIGIEAMLGPAKTEQAVTAVLAQYGLGAAFRAGLLSPEGSVSFIVDEMSKRELVADDVARERQATLQMQATRDVDRALPEDERVRRELRNLWPTATGDRIRRELHALGGRRETFEQWLADGDNLVHFWMGIPSIFIAMQLEVLSTKQAGRTLEPNDLRDMSFFATTLPYANIILSERYWGERMQAGKLDEAYGTRVLRTRAELPAALEAEGVL